MFCASSLWAPCPCVRFRVQSVAPESRRAARLFGSLLRFKVMNRRIQIFVRGSLLMTVLHQARIATVCIVAFFCAALAPSALAHEGHNHPDPRAFGGIMP